MQTKLKSIIETSDCWDVVECRASCGFGTQTLNDCLVEFADVARTKKERDSIYGLFITYGQIYMKWEFKLFSCLCLAPEYCQTVIVTNDDMEIMTDRRLTKISHRMAYRILDEGESIEV